MLFLRDFINFSEWYLYKNTWGQLAIFPSSRANTIRFDVTPQEKKDFCEEQFFLNSWNSEGVIELIANLLKNHSFDNSLVEAPIEQKIASLSRLASDILEMKPFIVRNFSMAKSIIPISKGFMVQV